MNKLKHIWEKVVAREAVHPVLTYPIFLMRVLICRVRYARTVCQLKAKRARGEKIRVLFLVSSVSKWKCQSLYEEMAKGTTYAPVMGITTTDEDEGLSPEALEHQLAGVQSWFEAHGNICERTTGRLEADIVFFQAPWGLYPGQRVWDVSSYALTCYMPYCIEASHKNDRSERFDHHHLANFHNLMWKNFGWSEAYARHYAAAQFPWEWAGETFGSGHTTLDKYVGAGADGEYVIYAPHFSFDWNGHSAILHIGTFDWTGRMMLEYAKAHPEIKWAWKPHPKLKARLVEIGWGTQAEVDVYYAEWENLGWACYDGDYDVLFKQSRALITDCDSFLTEYAAVDRPLIRFVPSNLDMLPCEIIKPYFETFYTCRDEAEIRSTFASVLERREDTKGDARRTEAAKSCLLDNYATGRILELLEKYL